MRVYVDKNIGVTDASLRYLSRVLSRHPDIDVISVTIDNYRAFSFEVYAIDQRTKETIFILLSGLNCGYNGTGPHGSIEALVTKLGVPMDGDDIVEKILSNDICIYHKDSGWAFKKIRMEVEA